MLVEFRGYLESDLTYHHIRTRCPSHYMLGKGFLRRIFSSHPNTDGKPIYMSGEPVYVSTFCLPVILAFALTCAASLIRPN